jgi:hypothetical protein
LFKKTVVLLLIACLMLAALPISPKASAAEGHACAAVLSAVMPGTGEWLNADWEGNFPWGECILGYICFFIHFSSVLDAAAGNDEMNGIRLGFWSTPKG